MQSTSSTHADVKQAHGSEAYGARAESNRANAQNSTGPRTDAGKARASANALKHGFFAATDHLDPQDAPSYQTALNDLRCGMRPANPAEGQAIQELATFRARLLRLQSIEYVLLCSEIDRPQNEAKSTNSDPNEFELTAAFLNNEAQLTRLSRAEAHLQRAYNRTWDRLLQLQKDRRKLASERTDDVAKRSQPPLTRGQQSSAANGASRKPTVETAPLAHPPLIAPVGLQEPEISATARPVLARQAA
jgi:hypothetical protein